MKNRPSHQPHQPKSCLVSLLLAGFLGLNLALLAPAMPVWADGDDMTGETGGQDGENPTPGDGENPDPENPEPEQPDPEQPSPEQPDDPGHLGGNTGGSTTTRPGNAVGGGANRPTPPSPNDNPTHDSNQVANTTKPAPSTTPAAPTPAPTPSTTDPEPSSDEQTVAKVDDAEAAQSADRTSEDHEVAIDDTATDSADLGTLIAVLALGSSLAVALPIAVVVGHKLLYSQA